MSNSLFGRVYANQYDSLYHEKDYEAECDMLEEVFRRYAKSSVQTVLDLGCGTGNHSMALARRGYQVTGVDRSAEMLVHARHKAETDLSLTAGKRPAFVEGDIRPLELAHSFDAVLMMFAVLGYQLTNDDVLAALHTVRRHLKPGGLFVCDLWYGPTVLAIGPSDRVKVIPIKDGQIIRTASGKLDVYRHLSEVHYHIWRLSGQQVVSEQEETHLMRYFFPQELALFMAQTQIELVEVRAFGDLERSPDESSWNVLVVGQAGNK